MRSISLLASASALDYRAYRGIANTRLNENCPDLDKADVCEKECIADVKECAEGCGSGKDCLNSCNRDLISCIDSCPCHTDCLDGCLNCMSPVCGCNDLENNEDYQDCSAKKEQELGACIGECGTDIECFLQCNAEYEASIEDCPCKANCPSGCPCDSYQCAGEDKAEYEILILSTFEKNSDPILVNFAGQVNDKIQFTFEPGTSVRGSCSLKFKNEFYIFGGDESAEKRQISRIQGCSLIRQQEPLPFDFVNGACGTFTLTEEFAFLCFSDGSDEEARTCHRWNGEDYSGDSFDKYEKTTTANHKHIRLADFLGQPLAVGGVDNNSVELLENGVWIDLPAYRYHNKISRYATVTIGKKPEDQNDPNAPWPSAYFFGGFDGIQDVDDVARLTLVVDPEDTLIREKVWFDVGKLNQRRRGHSVRDSAFLALRFIQIYLKNSSKVVSFGGESLIIGGHDLRQTEYWLEVDEGFYTTFQEPLLYRYESYPEVFVVQKNFCIDGIPHMNNETLN